MKRAVVVMVLVLGVSLTVFAGALDRFMAEYGTGNLHTLFFTDPVNLIKLLGEEPRSYDYYSSGQYSNQYIFTYVKPDTSSKVNTLAIVWDDLNNSIEEIRVGFAKGTTVEEALRTLGYTKDFFSSQKKANQRLGNVPYHAQVFTAKDIIKDTLGIKQNIKFIFLLNHFSNSVYMLIVQPNLL